MTDFLAQYIAQSTALGSGLNSQLVPDPNATGASQQQQPSDLMQPIGGLPNHARSRVWTQIQQQNNQPHTTSAGDTVGPQMGRQQQLQHPPGRSSQVPTFNDTTPQDTKRAALQELRDRAGHLHTNIKVIEQQQAALASQRSMVDDGVFLQRMAIAEQDIVRKRAVLTKWNMMLSANGMPPIGQETGQMNPTDPPSRPGVVLFHNTQQNPQAEQDSTLAPPPTLQSSHGVSIPPLDRIRFQGSFRHFCSTKKLVIDEAALNIGGRRVDLHTLHEEVLRLRATSRIATNFWHLVGAKLGFSGEQQASDEVAIRVATVYKQFLHQFDTIYVASFLQESQRRNSQGQPQSQDSAMSPQLPSSTGQISQEPHMSHPGNPPYTFNQMIPYAYTTAAELKMRGINEQFIAHVEEKRPHLQRFIEQHQEMRRKQSNGGEAVNDDGLPQQPQSPHPSDDKQIGQASNPGPTVLQTTDSPLKRVALLLFVICLFWFAFSLRDC